MSGYQESTFTHVLHCLDVTEIRHFYYNKVYFVAKLTISHENSADSFNYLHLFIISTIRNE